MKIFSWNDLIKKNILQNEDNFLQCGTSLTIGSFDGPHRGHLAVFNKVLNFSKENGTKSGIVTFEKPITALKEGKNYKGDISTLQERLNIFSELGFDFVLVIHFDNDFKNISGETFFSILKEKLNLKFVAEGKDFCCGKGGSFGKTEIESFCKKNKIQSKFIELVKEDGKRISSTMIRELIEKNELAEAKSLLK